MDIVLVARRQPSLGLFGFVGSVIFHGDMDVEVVARSGVLFLQERQKSLRPIAFVAFTDNEIADHIVCGKELGCNVASEIMGLALQSESRPDAPIRRIGKAGFFGHRAE